MATVYLCPLSAIFQYFNDLGVVLSGGKVNTYLAGSSTPQATYTDATGVTPNANPLILASNGRLNNVQIWQPQGVALKLVITDANNVQLGPVFDQVVGIGDPSKFLQSFYGGTDTGAANAYVLTFSAPFTSYVNGLVIYWLPSHTNTGASTININGLGAVNILNGDGSVLGANELQATVPATIISVGGVFLLVNPAYQSLFSNGSFTGTVFGCTTAPTKTITWAKSGRKVTLNIPATGTLVSNSTSFGYSGLPTNLQLSPGSASVQVWGVLAQDNGVSTYAAGDAFISASSGNINFEFKAGLWTNSGNKSMGAITFTYDVNADFT